MIIDSAVISFKLLYPITTFLSSMEKGGNNTIGVSISLIFTIHRCCFNDILLTFLNSFADSFIPLYFDEGIASYLLIQNL